MPRAERAPFLTWVGVDTPRRIPYSLAMADTDALVREALYRFVDDVSHLMRLEALETIEAALGTGGAGAARGGKRSPNQLALLSQRILDYVARNPGQRIEQIAQGMGTHTRALALPIKKLCAERKLVRRGQKRATTYSVK